MDFKVFFNGTAQMVYPARVSAMQFNQIYQGRQRSLDQTLISHFVSVELTEPGDLVVESSGFAGKNIEIRPFDYNIPFAADDSRVTIRLDKPGQFVLEAGDRDHVLHIFVNPPFHYEHSDNEIYFGPGIHHPGTISPVSGQTVCFDAGAVVYGHLKLVDVQDVKIVGPGILDSENIPRDPGNNMTNPEYITNSCFVSMNCKNIQVSDVIFRDAPIWAVVVRNNCRNVTFDNVKLIGMWRYNSDGIDICASQDVVIKNSFIRSFDDCFVARGAYLQNETEDVDNVLVENCVMWCDWGKCLEVWAGHLPCLIKNVTCRNIQIVHTSHIIADITTWFGSNDTKIRNITYENITLDIGEELLEPQIESKDTPVYQWLPRQPEPLVKICCEKLGRNLGNQHFGEVADPEYYNLSFENIVMRNFKFNKPSIPLSLLLDASQPRLKIKGVTLCDLGGMKVEQTGVVEDLSIE